MCILMLLHFQIKEFTNSTGVMGLYYLRRCGNHLAGPAACAGHVWTSMSFRVSILSPLDFQSRHSHPHAWWWISTGIARRMTDGKNGIATCPPQRIFNFNCLGIAMPTSVGCGSSSGYPQLRVDYHDTNTDAYCLSISSLSPKTVKELDRATFKVHRQPSFPT
jgi:hypothetical protein